jgi:hypothetical protein
MSKCRLFCLVNYEEREGNSYRSWIARTPDAPEEARLRRKEKQQRLTNCCSLQVRYNEAGFSNGRSTEVKFSRFRSTAPSRMVASTIDPALLPAAANLEPSHNFIRESTTLP